MSSPIDADIQLARRLHPLFNARGTQAATDAVCRQIVLEIAAFREDQVGKAIAGERFKVLSEKHPCISDRNVTPSGELCRKCGGPTEDLAGQILRCKNTETCGWFTWQ